MNKLKFKTRRALVTYRIALACSFYALAATMTLFGNGLLAIPMLICLAVAGWLVWRPMTRGCRRFYSLVFNTGLARAAHRGKLTFAQIRRRATATRAALRVSRHLVVDRGWPLVLTTVPAIACWSWVFLTGRP